MSQESWEAERIREKLEREREAQYEAEYEALLEQRLQEKEKRMNGSYLEAVKGMSQQEAIHYLAEALDFIVSGGVEGAVDAELAKAIEEDEANAPEDTQTEGDA